MSRQMRRILRPDDEGVASAVATMLVLLVIVIILQIVVIGAVPAQQYSAEWVTSTHDLQQLDRLRALAAGPTVAGSMFTVPFQMGTPAVSPFAGSSTGTLSYSSNDTFGMSLSYAFVPQFRQASVTTLHQDVALLMDNSGSMAWNDPQDLRITGAQEYVGRLSPPDCVAIVAFNGNSFLTRANVGGTPHHLYYPGMCGNPDYSQPQSDLGTITDVDSTNIGRAIFVGNTELIANGGKGKAWIEILLTDGQNECGGSVSPCGDTYTIQQAQIALANNITIFTIGLSSSADAALLTQIATITGGTYYAAPDASSIRWIYYQISMHYQSSIQCGSIFTSDAYGGALSMQLQSSQYPAQTMRFESGGIALIQSTGATMYQGLPFTYTRTSPDGGALTLPLVLLTGNAFGYAGTDTRVVQASVLAQQIVKQSIVRVDLGSEAASVGNISSNVTFWASQGAATPAAAAAVNSPLHSAQNELTLGDYNASTGNIAGAKFSVDRAQTRLSIAINVTEAQRAANAMQGWLAQQTEDSIRLEQCRVAQWGNWYGGLTLTITSPAAAAWASWFNATLTALKVPFSFGSSGNVAVVSIHALDTITTDRRVISLSGS
jgi:hypothetical protein